MTVIDVRTMSEDGELRSSFYAIPDWMGYIRAAEIVADAEAVVSKTEGAGRGLFDHLLLRCGVEPVAPGLLVPVANVYVDVDLDFESEVTV